MTMIKRNNSRGDLDPRASAVADLAATEGRELTTAELLARAQVYALLDVAEALVAVADGARDAGTQVEMGLGTLAESLPD